MDPETHGVGGEEGGRKASGVEENPGGGRHGVGGGVESFQENLTPNGMGGGVESFQDDSTPKEVGGGVQLSQDDSTPREVEEPRGDETPGALTASRYQWGEDGQGRWGGDENPPTSQVTRGQGPDGGDGAAQRGAMRQDGGAGRGDGDGGAGYPPEHFDGTDGATTENGKHLRREYGKVATEASKRGLARAGPATGEDGHGATNHSAGRTREEEGDKNPRLASSVQEPDGGETEESPPPPYGRVLLMRAAAKEGKG